MSTDLSFYRGDTYEKTLYFKTRAGVAVDITGATIWFTIKDDPDGLDADALLQKKITSHTSATGGVSTLTLSTTDTDIAPGLYWYDFQIKTSASKFFTLGSGRVEVKRDITLSTT